MISTFVIKLHLIRCCIFLLACHMISTTRRRTDQLGEFQKNDEKLTIIFGGDVTFSGVIRSAVKYGECTYNESFEEMRPIFKQADLVVVNFESALSNRDENAANPFKQVIVLSEEKSVESLKYAGISIVNVANNHLLDFGASNANNTINTLKSYGIKVFGGSFGIGQFKRQEPLIIQQNGITIGLLGYCLVNENCLESTYAKEIDVYPALYTSYVAAEDLIALRKKVDFVVVILHWGDEYLDMPNLQDEADVVKDIAPYVDAIIGSHAHITNGHYYYKKKLVAPQIGNLLFPMHLTVQAVFNKKKIVNREKYMKWFNQLTKDTPNRSAQGKIIKLTFNRTGLVPEETKYAKTKISVNSNMCLFVKPVSDWIEICSEEDEECRGKTDCNEIECRVDGDLFQHPRDENWFQEGND